MFEFAIKLSKWVEAYTLSAFVIVFASAIALLLFSIIIMSTTAFFAYFYNRYINKPRLVKKSIEDYEIEKARKALVEIEIEKQKSIRMKKQLLLDIENAKQKTNENIQNAKILLLKEDWKFKNEFLKAANKHKEEHIEKKFQTALAFREAAEFLNLEFI